MRVWVQFVETVYWKEQQERKGEGDWTEWVEYRQRERKIVVRSFACTLERAHTPSVSFIYLSIHNHSVNGSGSAPWLGIKQEELNIPVKHASKIEMEPATFCKVWSSCGLIIDCAYNSTIERACTRLFLHGLHMFYFPRCMQWWSWISRPCVASA